MAEQQQQTGQQEQGTQHPKAGRDLKGALAKLRDRTRELLEQQQEANRQELADLDRIRRRIKDQNEENRQEFARKETSLKADAVGEFRSTRDLVHERMARMKAQIGERKDAHDAKSAEKRAEAAEDYAAEVIAWVTDELDEAELAIIDAISARADAENVKRGAAKSVH